VSDQTRPATHVAVDGVLEPYKEVDSATCSTVVVALYAPCPNSLPEVASEAHPVSINHAQPAVPRPHIDDGQNTKCDPFSTGAAMNIPGRKLRRSPKKKINKVIVCAGQIRWPGAVSNRRPSDFQDSGAASVSDRRRPRPAPERPRDRWRTPANERERTRMRRKRRRARGHRPRRRHRTLGNRCSIP
jgi:hypothetical protein